MPRKLSDSIEQRIVELRDPNGRRRPEADIAAQLAREGIEVSVSGVHRTLARLGHAKPRPSTLAGKGRAVPAEQPSEATDAPDEDDVPGRLRRALASLERAASQAEADKDVGRMIAAQRAITAAAGLLAKATPPASPSLDERPDMIAAARRARERMHALLGRLLGESAS